MSPEDLATALFGAAKNEEENGILPEAMIARLAEFGERYGKNPFSVGDVVTPRRDSGLKYAGRPFLVVESHQNDDPPVFANTGDTDDHDFGRRINIRVAVVASHRNERREMCDTVVCFWNEAHNYELYEPAA